MTWRSVIELWNVVIRKKQGAQISSTYIKRVAKKNNINAPMDLSIEDCIYERSQMYNKIYECAKTAKSSRMNFIDSLADAIAAEGNIKKSSAIRSLNTK